MMWQLSTQRAEACNVRATLEFVGMRRMFGAAIVVICITVPLVESVDSWDHTLSDGNDTEANVVIAALCIGLAVSAAATIFRVMDVRLFPIDARFQSTMRVRRDAPREPRYSPLSDSSPPLALRL